VQKVALTDIREAEIRIDLMILPVEEAYVMLNKYQLTFNDGNAERVDTISYSWKLLKQQVSISFSCHLRHIRRCPLFLLPRTSYARGCDRLHLFVELMHKISILFCSF